MRPAVLSRFSLFQASQLNHSKTDKNNRDASQLHGTSAGGVYLWRSREDADRLYTDEWRAFVRGKYGSEPVLKYLETPVVVDNVSNEIISTP